MKLTKEIISVLKYQGFMTSTSDTEIFLDNYDTVEELGDAGFIGDRGAIDFLRNIFDENGVNMVGETKEEDVVEPEKVEETTTEPEKVKEKEETVVEPEPEKVEEKEETVVEPEPEKVEETTTEPEKVEEKEETVVEPEPEKVEEKPKKKGRK